MYYCLEGRHAEVGVAVLVVVGARRTLRRQHAIAHAMTLHRVRDGVS